MSYTNSGSKGRKTSVKKLSIMAALLLINALFFSVDVHSAKSSALLAVAGVSIPGDLDGNNIVDIFDVITLARSYMATPDRPNWNPNADINKDGIVDLYDAMILSSHFGEHSQQSMKIGMYTASWNFNQFTAETIANTFDMSQSWILGTGPEYVAKMNQVHALNPEYKALVYRNVLAIYKSYPYDAEWNLATNNGWLLKDPSGKYIVTYSGENYMVDIGNSDYQRWVANTIESWIDQSPFFDGVMVDNSLVVSARQWEAVGGGRPINPRTGTYFTDAEVFAGYSQLLNEIIAAVGPSKLVLPNGIWNGELFFGNAGYRTILSNVPELNALGSEGIFFQSHTTNWYTETGWLKSVDLLVWIQDNFLRGHPERYFNGWVPIDGQSLPVVSNREQLVMFGFCSMMLGAKYSEQNTIGFGETLHEYLDLITLIQELRSTDMIEPLNDYYKIPYTSVYARDFVAGKVLVNPTDVAYTITLNGSYTTLDGSVVSDSLAVNPHSGILLFN